MPAGPAFPSPTSCDRAGLHAGAVDVTFAGLDRGGYATVPDFVKSLSVDRAVDPDVLVAYEMNGEPLPFLNGFPVRLVVPGWYATYWVEGAQRHHRFAEAVRRLLDDKGLPHSDHAQRRRGAD